MKKHSNARDNKKTLINEVEARVNWLSKQEKLMKVIKEDFHKMNGARNSIEFGRCLVFFAMGMEVAIRLGENK